jgi:thiosulfate/3-mercaptopyruvate sulfurtransferase
MFEDLVVPAEWLAGRLKAEGVAVVDVRDAWEYDGIGHLPGAVSVPFEEFRSSEGDEGMLPGGDTWRTLMEAAGVDGGDRLVAYDDTHGVFAARFLVTALLYGHPPDRLHLLNGDYSAWMRERETESESPEVEPGDYEPGEPQHWPLVDADAVAEASESGAVLVDTRSPQEFEDGHIPGAVNLDWLELVDEESRGLRSREELERTLEEKDITPDRRTVLYCNTARRISHTYVVLKWLGYDDVAFYEGSLTAWLEAGREVESA